MTECKFENVFKAQQFKEVAFELGDLRDNRIIFAAWYPPGDSFPQSQHANTTSGSVMKELGMTMFDWIDVFPFAPVKNSQDLDKRALEKLLLADRTFGDAWITKIESRIADLVASNHRPIVFVCGKLCTEIWNKFDWAQEKSTSIYVSNYAHAWTSNRKHKFAVVFGQHPSAHLTGRGNFAATNRFQADMKMLFNLYYHNALIVSDSEKHRRTVCDQVSTELFGKDGWPKDMDHMLLMPFDDELYVAIVYELKKRDLIALPHFENFS